MLRKKLLSLSVTSAIALAAAAPTTHAIEMQSRTALANCMVEAAISIAATIASYKEACETGEWDINVLVDEWIAAKVPIQGSLTVTGENTAFELNGKMSAVFNPNDDPDVNCRVDTLDVGNTFNGVPFTYSSGDGTYYPEALTDKNSPLLDVTTFLSEGNVTITTKPRVQLGEEDHLDWGTGPDGTFMASGWINVTKRQGSIDQIISEWITEDEGDEAGWVEYIPDLDLFSEEELEGWMDVEVISDDLGVDECEIKVEADATITALALELEGELEIEAESADE